VIIPGCKAIVELNARRTADLLIAGWVIPGVLRSLSVSADVSRSKGDP
jgi:hypothetical protein